MCTETRQDCLASREKVRFLKEKVSLLFLFPFLFFFFFLMLQQIASIYFHRNESVTRLSMEMWSNDGRVQELKQSLERADMTTLGVSFHRLSRFSFNVTARFSHTHRSLEAVQISHFLWLAQWNSVLLPRNANRAFSQLERISRTWLVIVEILLLDFPWKETEKRSFPREHASALLCKAVSQRIAIFLTGDRESREAKHREIKARNPFLSIACR